MKTIILTVAVLSIFFSTSFAQGDGHNHAAPKTHDSHSSMNMNQSEDGKSATLTGQLIGLTCYIKHGSIGKDHKSCAKSCAEKGLPIGILSDGKIYQVSGDGHTSLVEAYKPLIKYMEEKVQVKGTIYEKNGVKLIEIKKIRKP